MSVTYSFSPNTRIKSAEVNQNYTECVSPFTVWTAWVPVFAGFAADPTLNEARYTQLGKTVIVVWTGNANGTKSGVTGTITMTLPVAPKYNQSFANLIGYYSAGFRMLAASITAASTTMTVGILNSVPDIGATLVSSITQNLTFGFGGVTNVMVYEVS